VFAADIQNIEGKPTIFPYSVLKVATKNFDPNCKLGEGGFGSVFKVPSTVNVNSINWRNSITFDTFQGARPEMKSI